MSIPLSLAAVCRKHPKQSWFVCFSHFKGSLIYCQTRSCRQTYFSKKIIYVHIIDVNPLYDLHCFLFIVWMHVAALLWLWQDDNLMLELDDMQRELESTQGEKARTVKDLLTSRCVRWQLLTIAIPCAGSQFGGINAVCSFHWSHSLDNN